MTARDTVINAELQAGQAMADRIKATAAERHAELQAEAEARKAARERVARRDLIALVGLVILVLAGAAMFVTAMASVRPSVAPVLQVESRAPQTPAPPPTPTPQATPRPPTVMETFEAGIAKDYLPLVHTAMDCGNSIAAMDTLADRIDAVGRLDAQLPPQLELVTAVRAIVTAKPKPCASAWKRAYWTAQNLVSVCAHGEEWYGDPVPDFEPLLEQEDYETRTLVYARAVGACLDIIARRGKR